MEITTVAGIIIYGICTIVSAVNFGINIADYNKAAWFGWACSTGGWLKEE
jgi:hypothetical protein